MDDPTRPDCAALLAHVHWVRGLARQLVADAHAADDLAQDALAAALARRGPLRVSLGAWLAGVVRNLARSGERAAANRTARERAATRDASDSGDPPLLERLEAHRSVVDAVGRLPEPIRTAILLRWFEGLAPAEIAARTGAPLRTVHTRLQRGLARLRADLDRRRDGDRPAWLLACLPYAAGSTRWPFAAPCGSIGALLVDAKLKIALVLVAAVALGATALTLRNRAVEPSLAAPADRAAAPALAEERASSVAPSQPAVPPVRVADAGRAAPVQVEPAPSAPPRVLRGRVIDVERAPVAGLRVRCSGAETGAVEAYSDARGAFELPRPAGAVVLDAASPGWTTLFRPELDAAHDGDELVLVVAPAATLGGTVRDAAGRALTGATVVVPVPFDLRARLPAVLDDSSTVERSARADERGRFELADVPLVADLHLVTTHPGYVADERALPQHDELALEIVLRPADADHLTGRVLHADGRPAADAWVALGERSARTGARGEFALEPDDAGQSARVLRAAKAGWLPAEVERDTNGAWPAPLVLTLGEEALVIAGRVLDADGAPVPHAEVWTDGEQPFGRIPIGGGETVASAGATLEGVLRGDPWTPRVRGGADGRFELAGLLASEYRVHALDRRRLMLATAVLPAGTRDAELRFAPEERHPRVAGRVTTLDGEPLAGVRVVLARAPLGDDRSPLATLVSLPDTTDAEGRFAFEDVSRALVALSVHGPELDLDGTRHALVPDEDVAHLELRVPLNAHVQVEAAAPDEFDEVAVLDERGQRLVLTVRHGASSYAMGSIALHEGRTEAFSVSERGATLLLLAEGAEVRRVPLALARGELNALRP